MNIILIGAGGHANSCIEVIKNTKNRFKIFGHIVKKKEKKKSSVLILGYEKDINKIMNKHKCNNILLAFGQIKSSQLRKKLFLKLKKDGFNFPIIKSKYSIISKESFIDEGTIIMNRVCINKNAKIGKNCIINTGAIIEHDVLIEDNCHIAPGAIVNGGVVVKEGSFIGSGSVIKQNITIKKNSIIQAGTFHSKKR